MRNHHVANNTKPISQQLENNLKPVAGNNNRPKIHDKNNTMDLRNENNNIRIHLGEYPTLNKN